MLASQAPTKGEMTATAPVRVLAMPKYRAKCSAGANSGTIIMPETIWEACTMPNPAKAA